MTNEDDELHALRDSLNLGIRDFRFDTGAITAVLHARDADFPSEVAHPSSPTEERSQPWISTRERSSKDD